MRRFVIANTYYQLITAIQLKNTLFADDEVVLLISDHSNHADRVAENLKKAEIFEEVHYICSKGLITNRSKAKKILDGLCISFGGNSSFSFYLNGIQNLFFDEIVVYNLGADVYSIFSLLYRYNPKITVSLMEEGILSYRIGNIGTSNWNHINRLRQLLGKQLLTQSFQRFYCFFPAVYSGDLSIVPIPRIRLDSAAVKQIQAVFEIDSQKLNYSSRYIFFTSVYDFEGGAPIGEFELACRIADLVGINNLLIKQHPRDERTVYADYGFCVDKNSSIPWEAIQVSADFGSVTYLTVNSGSVLSGSTLSQKPIRTFYLYPLCDYSRNEACKKSVQDIEKVLETPEMKSILKDVHIAGKLEDIL